jgi:fatty acid desaturase
VDEELDRQTADEVLEAAWPKERRRARRRMLSAMVERVALFLLALGGLSFVVWLLFGLVVPWTFFAFMAVLTLVGGRPDPDERALLRRGADPAGGSGEGPAAGPASGRA